MLTATCYKNNNPNLTLICPRYDIQDSKSKLTVESRPTERSSQERMASCLLGCTVVVAVLFDVDVEGKVRPAEDLYFTRDSAPEVKAGWQAV